MQKPVLNQLFEKWKIIWNTLHSISIQNNEAILTVHQYKSDLKPSFLGLHKNTVIPQKTNPYLQVKSPPPSPLKFYIWGFVGYDFDLWVSNTFGYIFRVFRSRIKSSPNIMQHDKNKRFKIFAKWKYFKRLFEKNSPKSQVFGLIIIRLFHD